MQERPQAGESRVYRAGFRLGSLVRRCLGRSQTTPAIPAANDPARTTPSPRPPAPAPRRLVPALRAVAELHELPAAQHGLGLLLGHRRAGLLLGSADLAKLVLAVASEPPAARSSAPAPGGPGRSRLSALLTLATAVLTGSVLPALGLGPTAPLALALTGATVLASLLLAWAPVTALPALPT